MKRVTLLGCLVVLNWPVVVRADVKALLLGELEPDALVVTDLTPEGKARAQPTAEKPVYYYYRPGGFRELGDVVANEKRPNPERIEQLLVKTLEKRHYLRATKESPQPTIVVSAWWGTMNPGATTELGFHEDENVGVEISEHNKKQALMIVGGSKFSQNAWINSDQARVMQEAVEDRFFLFVSAYDAAAVVKKEKKPLWFTRISLPSSGVSMDDVMATLVASGGPFYGKETKSVEFVDPTKIRKAEVRLGDVIVLPDDQKSGAPAEPPAQPKP